MNTNPFNILHHIYIIGDYIRRLIEENPVQLCYQHKCNGYVSPGTASENVPWKDKFHVQCKMGRIPFAGDLRLHEAVLWSRNDLVDEYDVCADCLADCGFVIVGGIPRKRECSGTTFNECKCIDNEGNSTPKTLPIPNHSTSGLCHQCCYYHQHNWQRDNKDFLNPRQGSKSTTTRQK